MTSPRARIVERTEDLIRSAPFRGGLREMKIGGTREIGAHAEENVVVEGLAEPGPLMRALHEAELPFRQQGDSLAFRASLAELATIRGVLLRRAEPASDAVVSALDSAFASILRFPKDVVWPGGSLAVSKRAHVMGIVNVTPDSFSDGGLFLDEDAAVKHGLELVADGADILDVGGESTRPGADPVPVGEEILRVVPVVEALAAATEVPVSIDTMKAEVARAALDAGASIVNDVSAGRFDAGMLPLVAEREAPVVLMHMLGDPRTMQKEPRYRDVVGEIYAFLAERTEAAVDAGIDRDRILLDPGFGFGKTREHNLELLRRIRELRCLGLPIVAGTSRKSFIGATLDLPVGERFEGTAATVALAVWNGAAVVRVHDVRAMQRVAGMVEAVKASVERGER